MCSSCFSKDHLDKLSHPFLTLVSLDLTATHENYESPSLLNSFLGLQGIAMVWFSHPFSLTGSSFSFSHLYGWAFAPGSILNLVFSLPAVLWEHIKIKIVLICSHKLASHSPQLARHHHPENSLPPMNMSKTESIFPFQNWLSSSWQHYLNFRMFLCHLTIFIFNLPLCVCMCVCAQLPSRVQLLATPWTAPHQALLSMGISQARILKWVAITTPRDLPDQGLNPCLLHLLHWQADTFTLHHLGSP